MSIVVGDRALTFCYRFSIPVDLQSTVQGDGFSAKCLMFNRIMFIIRP